MPSSFLHFAIPGLNGVLLHLKKGGSEGDFRGHLEVRASCRVKTRPMICHGACNLWKLEKADLGEHYRWANNDNLRRLVGGPPQPRSLSEIETWFQTVVNDPKQQVFSIKLHDTSPLGWAQIFSLDHVCGSAELGIVLDEEYWGKGYGHDALVALIKYCFEDLRLHRLGAEVLAINLPSKGLFETLGFQIEGVKRESYYTSGRFLDVNVFGLLSREFTCPQARTT